MHSNQNGTKSFRISPKHNHDCNDPIPNIHQHSACFIGEVTKSVAIKTAPALNLLRKDELGLGIGFRVSQFNILQIKILYQYTYRNMPADNFYEQAYIQVLSQRNSRNLAHRSTHISRNKSIYRAFHKVFHDHRKTVVLSLHRVSCAEWHRTWPCSHLHGKKSAGTRPTMPG
jgi:hypothetical protein